MCPSLDRTPPKRIFSPGFLGFYFFLEVKGSSIDLKLGSFKASVVVARHLPFPVASRGVFS